MFCLGIAGLILGGEARLDILAVRFRDTPCSGFLHKEPPDNARSWGITRGGVGGYRYFHRAFWGRSSWRLWQILEDMNTRCPWHHSVAYHVICQVLSYADRYRGLAAAKAPGNVYVHDSCGPGDLILARQVAVETIEYLLRTVFQSISLKYFAFVERYRSGAGSDGGGTSVNSPHTLYGKYLPRTFSVGR